MASIPKVHVFSVEMTCQGCANAVNNVLNKHKDQGISSFDIDLTNRNVAVTSSLDPSNILEIIKKTGKTTSYIGEKQ